MKDLEETGRVHAEQSASAAASRDVYFKILAKFEECEVAILAESRMVWVGPLPVYVRTPDRPHRAEVHVERESGGLQVWPGHPKTNSSQAKLFHGAIEVSKEICQLAHELGHHHSPFAGYEAIMSRHELDPDSITAKERQEVYEEEMFAWAWARGFLADVGFAEMAFFEEYAAQSLGTYAQNLGIKNST